MSVVAGAVDEVRLRRRSRRSLVGRKLEAVTVVEIVARMVGGIGKMRGWGRNNPLEEVSVRVRFLEL